jgi:hypothetical protein
MQQLWVVLPFLLIIWTMLIAFRIGAYLDAKARKNSPKPVEVPEKTCPLHDWKWIEQPGLEDQNVVYMLCQRCKKTPKEISNETN